MIKYYHNERTRETFAVLNGTEMDAINKINKCFGNMDWMWCTKKYLMPDSFKVKVKLAVGDVHDMEKAKVYAKQKLLKKYYKEFDRRMDMFKCDLLEVNHRAFEEIDYKN